MTKRRRRKKKKAFNPDDPMGKPISTERARELSMMRKHFGAGSGRPREKRRCPCGKFTLPRARSRGHKCNPAREDQ